MHRAIFNFAARRQEKQKVKVPQENFVLNIRQEAAQKEASDAIFAAEREQMEKAKLDAKAMSPKLTGKNAASIGVRLRRVQNGMVRGMIFTESGYGGYIERGTAKIPARPYIYPAALKDLGAIVANARVRIANIKGK
jgi:hypothetical protein